MQFAVGPDQVKRRLNERRILEDLKRKTAGAVLWTILRSGWSSIAVFTLFVFLARLLSPEDFGFFALASILVEVGRVLSSGGLGDAVIRAEAADDRFLSTVFWLNLALALVFGAALAIAAPFYAEVFGGPQISPIIYALAAILPFGALGAVHGALLAREFRYAALTMQSMLASLVSGAVAVGMAWHGFGVWSLVGQAATSTAISTIFAWWALRWRPRFLFDFSIVRSVAAFGASLAATQLIWMLLVRVQDLFLGKFYGPEAVGLYRIAWRLIEMIASLVLGPIGGVSLVVFSRLQGQPERLQNIYNRIIQASSLLTFPLLFGFAATASLVIPLVFGPSWSDAVPVSQVLVLMAIPFVFNFFAGPVLTAANRAGAVLQVAVVQLATTLIFTWFAVRYGLVAVAGAYVLRAYITMPLQQYMLQKYAGIRMVSTWKAMVTPLVCAGLMAALVFAVVPLLIEWLGPGWMAVAAAVALGASFYGATIVLLAKDEVKDIIKTLMSVRTERNRA